MSPAELAWAAGLFEGEGWIVCGEYKSGSSRSMTVRVGIHMTDKDVVDRFAALFPFGNRGFREGTVSEITGARKKDSWVWQTGSAEHVQAFLAMVWPWLGQRRRARAAETIAACARISRRGHNRRKQIGLTHAA